jgi:hypothetical protein
MMMMEPHNEISSVQQQQYQHPKGNEQDAAAVIIVDSGRTGEFPSGSPYYQQCSKTKQVHSTLNRITQYAMRELSSFHRRFC